MDVEHDKTLTHEKKKIIVTHVSSI